MDCCVRVGPDVVEERQKIKMKSSLNGKFTQQKVECRDGGAAAKLQEASQDLVLVGGDCLHVSWADGKG